MADATLTVGSLRAELAVLGDPAAVAPARAWFDRAVAERLPALLAAAAAPALDGRDGVVRLRRLRLALDHVGPLDETLLARVLAERLVAALRAALARSDGEVRVWASRTDYLASYVETRLGLEPGPDWPFPDLAPLALLAPGEAAVQVLRARPAVLAVLARRGAVRGEPARVVRRLLPGDTLALVAGLADDAPGGPPAAGDVARLVAADSHPDVGAMTTGADRARAVLGLLLRSATDGRPASAPPVRAALAVLALRLVAHDRAARGAGRLAPQHLAPGLAATSVAPLPARLAAALEAAVDAGRTDRALHAALVGALPPVAAVSSGDGADGGDRPTRAATAARATAPRSLVSPVAGLALLLPGVVRHDLARLLAPSAVRAAVLSALGEQVQRGAATDPLVAALLPADPRAPVGAVPPVPAAAGALLSGEVRGLMSGRDGVAGWGDLLLATFADRLPGLRASSRGWLQQQFLHAPGRLDLADDLVHVTLEGPPLAVVLGMAGFDGPQGVLPHLDGRRLLITLTGLRR